MKCCFIKQGTSATFATWESHEYCNSEMLLRAFRFKSKLFSLLVELQADIWVVEGDMRQGSFMEEQNEYSRAILAKHKAVPLDSVPFERYDVIISVLPIVPDRIIRKHPHALWCYVSVAHVSKLHRKSMEKPLGMYDLFLDHATLNQQLSNRLPCSVSFPFPTNRELMRQLVCPTSEDAVFLDTRLIKRESLGWFRQRTDLKVRCSPSPPLKASLITEEKMVGTWEYLQSLGTCKYFLTARKRGFVGQALLEAASLDLIIVSSPGVYANVLCHPECMVPPNDLRAGIAKVNEVEERGLKFQERVLAHQRAVLDDIFWRKPIGLLGKAATMKKEKIL